MENYIGEISALLAGCCYALISVIFENASKRVGPTNVAVTRTVFGLIMLTIYNVVIHHTLVIVLPVDSMTYLVYLVQLDLQLETFYCLNHS